MNIKAVLGGSRIECILGFSFKNVPLWDNYALFSRRTKALSPYYSLL